MHGLIRGLSPLTTTLAIVALVAGCTSGEADDSGATDEGSTETGDVDPGPICGGAPAEADITINSPDDFDQILGVECIPGRLIIDDSVDSLPDLQGLETLKEIGCFEIRSNRTLTSLNGLQNVWRIGNPEVQDCGIKVLSTGKLPDLSELKSLTYVNVPITINYNDVLTGLAGLEQLTDAPLITLQSNTMLEDFSGLSGLESVGKLDINDNDALTDMSGFARLEEIRGELLVEKNDGLTSLDGFTLLQRIGSTIKITSNSMLPTCTAIEFAEGIADKGGAAVITKNLADTCGD